MSRDDAARRRALTLPFLPAPLLEPRRPGLVIPLGWLTAIVPSLLLSALAQWLVPNAAQPEFGATGAVFLMFMLVVFAPVIETLIMGAVLLVLLRIVGPAVAVAISAIGWGIAHSLAVPTWGLVIWWPFLIFSTLFVVWRERSLLAAFAVPAAVHALQNVGPALVVASERSL